MTEPDLQRWSREVAEDPGSPAFVPLARAYRRQGRRPAAMSLVLRGLERDPQNVEGHALLALLHVDAGERERAGDEWDVILRLDPENFDAHRGLGFLALERNDLEGARRHLEAAAEARPDDPAVSQAREVLGRRERRAADDGPGPDSGEQARETATREQETQPASRTAPSAAGDETVPDAEAAPADGRAAAGEAVGEAAAHPEAASEAAAPPSPSARISDDGRRDPARLFDPLAREGPFVGALLLDERGLVLAGAMPEGRGEMLGAMLDSAIDEARRTARLLELGAWAGVFLECDGASLHVAPLQDEIVLAVAVAAGTPVGWLVRAAERARTLAREYLEGAL